MLVLVLLAAVAAADAALRLSLLETDFLQTNGKNDENKLGIHGAFANLLSIYTRYIYNIYFHES